MRLCEHGECKAVQQKSPSMCSSAPGTYPSNPYAPPHSPHHSPARDTHEGRSESEVRGQADCLETAGGIEGVAVGSQLGEALPACEGVGWRAGGN